MTASGAASETRAWVAIAVCLAAAGGLAWWLQLREPVDSDPEALAALPATIAGRTGRDIPLEQSVEDMLRADFHVQREYVDAVGEPVWLYVGYYGTRRGGTPEHTPRTCYTAHGWRIQDQRDVALDPAGGLHAREYRVQLGGHERLVHFWYRSYRSTGMRSLPSLCVDHFLGRLLARRADGALVRVSTPLVAGDDVAARSRLSGFAAALEPLLERHWPPPLNGGSPPGAQVGSRPTLATVR